MVFRYLFPIGCFLYKLSCLSELSLTLLLSAQSVFCINIDERAFLWPQNGCMFQQGFYLYITKHVLHFLASNKNMINELKREQHYLDLKIVLHTPICITSRIGY